MKLPIAVKYSDFDNSFSDLPKAIGAYLTQTSNEIFLVELEEKLETEIPRVAFNKFLAFALVVTLFGFFRWTLPQSLQADIYEPTPDLPFVLNQTHYQTNFYITPAESRAQSPISDSK